MLEMCDKSSGGILPIQPGVRKKSLEKWQYFLSFLLDQVLLNIK